jgi:ammonia channel protein AmtB
MVVYLGLGNTPSFAAEGGLHLLKVQLYAGLWVIVFSAAATFALLKLVGLVIPLRMSEKDMEAGDLAVHGHEVYPSDVPSLGFHGSVPSLTPPPTPEPAGG